LWGMDLVEDDKIPRIRQVQASALYELAFAGGGRSVTAGPA